MSLSVLTRSTFKCADSQSGSRCTVLIAYSALSRCTCSSLSLLFLHVWTLVSDFLCRLVLHNLLLTKCDFILRRLQSNSQHIIGTAEGSPIGFLLFIRRVQRRNSPQRDCGYSDAIQGFHQEFATSPFTKRIVLYFTITLSFAPFTNARSSTKDAHTNWTQRHKYPDQSTPSDVSRS